jgi:hypothetical protein
LIDFTQGRFMRSATMVIIVMSSIIITGLSMVAGFVVGLLECVTARTFTVRRCKD